jgi:hypothetical protein
MSHPRLMSTVPHTMFTEEEEFIFLLLLLDSGLFFLRAQLGLEMDPSTTQPENEDPDGDANRPH